MERLLRLAPLSTLAGILLAAAMPLSQIVLAEDPPALGEEPPVHRGTAVVVRNAGNYTYLQVEEGDDTYWIATPHTMVPAGAVIEFAEQVWMYDFPSKVLNRTFDKVLFVGQIEIRSRPETPAEEAGSAPPPSAAAEGVTADAGQVSIADAHVRKAELAGQLVTVSGEVVKIMDKIMGSSWIHIEDASSPTSNHMVVRVSDRQVEVGDNVTARGILKADADYGYGYFYPIIIENAVVTTEAK